MMFLKVLDQLGIADAIKAKFVAPQAGEMIGGVVARGDAGGVSPDLRTCNRSGGDATRQHGHLRGPARSRLPDAA